MNTKQKILLISAIVVGVVVLVIFYRDVNHPVLTQKIPVADSAVNVAKWEAKSDDLGVVSATVTPLELSPNAGEWKFDVVLNTHSVELDWDMVKVSTLVDDRGNTYSPQKWEGALSGHHREGVLIFKPIVPAPKSVELTIAGGGLPAKSFAWSIKN